MRTMRTARRLLEVTVFLGLAAFPSVTGCGSDDTSGGGGAPGPDASKLDAGEDGAPGTSGSSASGSTSGTADATVGAEAAVGADAAAAADAAVGADADSDDTGSQDTGSEHAGTADAGSDGPAVCTPMATRCSGGGVETCGSSGQWASAVACTSDAPLCAHGACLAPSQDGGAETPPSCLPGGPGMTNCGPGGSGFESCCTSLEVPGGTYYRTYDPLGEDGGVILAADGGPGGEADPATVSGFRMDKYLVTAGRFRQYVNYLTSDAGAPPVNGSGLHTHLNGGLGLANSGSPGTYETGWDAADWNAYLTSADSATLVVAVPGPTTLGYGFPPIEFSSDNLPMTGVDWYEAYAFCIWDGGFLPSETEWEYVAAAGSQEREYPWGAAAPGVSNEYAIFGTYYTAYQANSVLNVPYNLAPVGTAVLGAGYWGQLDMAGETAEWNLDWYAPYVDPCVDCAYLTGPYPDIVPGMMNPDNSRVIRGARYAQPSANGALLASPDSRNFEPPFFAGGIRCARTP